MKLMKFILVLALLSAAIVPADAQLLKTNWHHLSPTEDGVYGIDLEKAYGLLEGMKPKKEVIVAIIGPGNDIEHVALKASLWKNKKEKADGKDNDKNGKTDDLYGWNYLGNASGDVLEEALGFGDREFLRLKDKYDNIHTEDEKFYIVSEDETQLIEIDPPADRDEYDYYIKEVRPLSQLSSTYGGIYLSSLARYYTKPFSREIRELFPDKEDFTHDEFLEMAKTQTSHLAKLSALIINVPFAFNPGVSWNRIVAHLDSIAGKPAEKYQDLVARQHIGDRELVGDDPYNINDTRYGNDILLTENAGKGALLSGVIAARENGIAADARIMTLRITPYESDWIPKDLALSIRYAADNKADVILLPQSLAMNLYGDQKKWIEEALEYAASKDILIVQPVNDMSFDLGDEYFSPNRTLDSGVTLPNIITVAASDENGNPMLETNYGHTALDVFAPGKDIYSTYTGDAYRMESGSDMAGAVTAGVAALIRSYFPTLTAAQVREALINSVTGRQGTEVEKQIMVKQNGSARSTKDLFLFEELCVSGGIVNAAGAVSKAAGMAGSKK